MKKILIVSTILVLGFTSLGQNYRITYNFGYNSYNQSDLKGLQIHLANSSPFEGKVMEHFPNFIHHSLQAEYSLSPIHSIGILSSYMTTGGRNHVADYSGEYRLDLTLNGVDLALQYKYIQEITPRIRMYEKLAGGVTFTALRIEEELKVDNETFGDIYKFRSFPFWGSFSVGAMISVTNNVWIDLNIGYQHHFSRRFYLKGRSDAYLRNDYGEQIDCNWSGFRSGIGVSYSF